jgi:outer membrane protein with beta-barrel domain
MFMKKIILASLFMAGLAFGANAQKGSVLVYGTVGFSTTKSEPSDTKSTNFSLMPGIGYQFSNNWTVGIAGGVRTSKTESITGESKLNAFAAGPFVRYTKNLSNTFFFFSQLDAQYSSATNKLSSGGEVEYTGFDIGVTPAIGVKVYKGLALNFSFGSMGYATDKTKGTSNKSSGFNFTLGSQANIGVSVNL